MKCPNCTINFHENWNYNSIHGHDSRIGRADVTKCPSCEDYTVMVQFIGGEQRMIYPMGANRGPVPAEVPKEIAEDYIEACNVLPISPKASAALSRRCLQSILHANGYKGRDLSKEIDLLLNDPDPSKGIPVTLRTTQ